MWINTTTDICFLCSQKMELAVSSELQASPRGLSGSYLPLMQINVWSPRAFTLLPLHFVVVCQPLEDKDTEVHVREEIDSHSEQRTHLDAKLPSGRSNTSALLQREVQPTEATFSFRAFEHPVLAVPTIKAPAKNLPCSVPFAQGCTPWPHGCLALAVPCLGCLLSPEHQLPWPAGLLVSFCPFTC